MREALRLAVVTVGLAAFAATSRSDVGTTSTGDSGAAIETDFHDPTTPYPLGPDVIQYEQLTPAEQAGVDQIRENVETSQLPASNEAFSRATTRARELAELKLAARSVGLTNTDDDGLVTP